MRTNGLTQTNNNTKVSVSVNIDGSGKSKISTDCSFLNHLLHVFSLYSKCDIYLNCDCSKKCGYQHQIDDIASALGSAVKASLGDRRGIIRFADSTVPMDDALVLCAIDISGRDYLSFDVDFPSEKIEDFDTELIRSFFSSFVQQSGSACTGMPSPICRRICST